MDIQSSITSKNILVVILTSRSPFGTVPEFVEDELPFWGNARKLMVVSLAEKYEQQKLIAKNAEAFAVCALRNPLEKIIAVLKGLLEFDIVIESLKIIAKPRRIIKKYWQLAIFAQLRKRYYQGLEKILANQPMNEFEVIIFYSYWFGPGTHAAVKIKQKLKLNKSIVITRAHGSDLYEYANPSDYLPFRKRLAKACNCVYPISQHGMNYLIDHWGCPVDKISLARLGILDHFEGCYPNREKAFHILSCGYVNPVKQIHLIAEALSYIEDINVLWTHIGAGPDFERLKDICAAILKKNNIKYDLRGNLLHKDVIDALKNENFNLLINTSSSEGIPVSMMEAQCSGIPVLAPCVGGIKEIIEHDVNGRLLNPNFTVQELQGEIISIIQMDNEKYIQMCLNSRNKWCAHYSAQQNYPKLVQSVICEKLN